MKENVILGIVTRRMALVLNALIVAAYAAIAVFAGNPWLMLAGFLFLAVAIRSATLLWGADSFLRIGI